MKPPPGVTDRWAGGSLNQRLKGPFLSHVQGNLVNKMQLHISKVHFLSHRFTIPMITTAALRQLLQKKNKTHRDSKTRADALLVGDLK